VFLKTSTIEEDYVSTKEDVMGLDFLGVDAIYA